MAQQINPIGHQNHAVDIVLETVFRLYGYDFRNYARASLTRRLEKTINQLEIAEIIDLVPLLFKEPSVYKTLLANMSVTVTSFFRDPEVFKVIREKIVPVLKTYPFVKIWHAGCALGMEPYSMSILLDEENFLNKCQIYSTDFNADSLEKARAAIFDDSNISLYEENYISSGGKGQFSDFITQSYNSFILNKRLHKNVTFSHHNLISDKSFGEMNMVFCRNVLIYFDKQLQNRVLQLLTDSLCHRGYLCLGNRETIEFTSVAEQYEVISPQHKIYRKK